jgi:hypothetical protein
MANCTARGRWKWIHRTETRYSQGKANAAIKFSKERERNNKERKKGREI